MNVHLPAPQRRWAARLVNLAVVFVVLALAAAAFVLSYGGVHAIASQSGVSARLARVYPATFDAVLVIACVAALMLRDARWWARCYAWFAIILLVAVVGTADAVHAMHVALQHKTMEGVVAATPWVLALLGFSLMLTILQHSRAQHAAAAPGAGRRARREGKPDEPVRPAVASIKPQPELAASPVPPPALPSAVRPVADERPPTLVLPATAEREAPSVPEHDDQLHEGTAAQAAEPAASAAASEADSPWYRQTPEPPASAAGHAASEPLRWPFSAPMWEAAAANHIDEEPDANLVTALQTRPDLDTVAAPEATDDSRDPGTVTTPAATGWPDETLSPAFPENTGGPDDTAAAPADTVATHDHGTFNQSAETDAVDDAVPLSAPVGTGDLHDAGSRTAPAATGQPDDTPARPADVAATKRTSATRHDYWDTEDETAADGEPPSSAPFVTVPRLNRVRATPQPPEEDDE